MKHLQVFLLCLSSIATKAQLFIEPGAELYLQKNAEITIQGDVVGHSDIIGGGTVYLAGDDVQEVNLNGFSIPALHVMNKGGMNLTGKLKINESLWVDDAVVHLNSFDLELGDASIISAGQSGGIETNGTGILRKYVRGDVADYFLPLVNKNGSTPVVVTSRGNNSRGYLEVSSLPYGSRNAPADATDYLNNHWKITRSGIKGDVDLLVQYEALGNRAELSGFVWKDQKWAPASTLNKSGIVVKLGEGSSEVTALRMKNELALYPNPAADGTTLSCFSASGGKGTIVITDSRGSIVQTQAVQLVKGFNRVNIYFNNLAAGQYDVSLKTFGTNSTLKLVKL